MFASAVDLRLQSSSWQNEFDLVAQRPFLFLRGCGKCGQLWQFDLIDKYQTCLAIKIDTNVDWPTFDDKPVRLEYLIRSRGGVSDEECVMQGCKDFALYTLAYCPAHAFEYAGLRE